jgi:hypothetical protein
MWTVANLVDQRAKLANESVYSTRMDNFEGHDTSHNDQSQYITLYRTFGKLLNDPSRGVSLADIALSRANGNDEDCARALPTLGLQEIIQARPDHAARIAGLHGLRGLPPPYGSPRSLAGLSRITIDGLKVTRTGATIRVKRVNSDFERELKRIESRCGGRRTRCRYENYNFPFYTGNKTCNDRKICARR